MMKRINSYEELRELYDKGVRKVYVKYNEENWGLPKSEIVSEIHSIVDLGPLEYNRLDLRDSRGCLLGLVDCCLTENLVEIYEVEVSNNE